MDLVVICHIYFVNSDLQTLLLIAQITDMCTGELLIFYVQIFPILPESTLLFFLAKVLLGSHFVAP